MENEVLKLTEKQVQGFIADYPWLLNFDYERVPRLKNKGMEYKMSDGKRADLILRDRKSERPVIVEFKKVDFYRENIGQILEYKARIVSEITNADSVLKEIFDDKILVPILVLVVPKCTAEARLACNLSNIDIYEYNKTIPEIIIPEKRKTLNEFIEHYKNDDISFNEDRDTYINEIYSKIKELMKEENCADAWKDYRNPSGEYFVALNHLFINKWIFSDSDISIGIYEDIFSNCNNINIEYYSCNQEILSSFVEKYKDLNLVPEGDKIIDDDKYAGQYFWRFSISKKSFIENTKKVLRTHIRNYKAVMEELHR
ncbi:hypothetical protein [Clostridium butyricum]|uniref:hypothetical protein n=1 Tax=Clostridium butyricum TaxID=1492 RepID=UPI0032C194B8